MWYKDKVEQQWCPGVTVGGHSASVEDLDWEPNKGMYSKTSQMTASKMTDLAK